MMIMAKSTTMNDDDDGVAADDDDDDDDGDDDDDDDVESCSIAGAPWHCSSLDPRQLRQWRGEACWRHSQVIVIFMIIMIIMMIVMTMITLMTRMILVDDDDAGGIGVSGKEKVSDRVIQ